MLREFSFKTAAHGNLLCQFTERNKGSWILIHLLRPSSKAKAERAMFTIHADPTATDRFLVDEFGRRYGTYEVLSREGDLTSVEVSNYLLPTYRGLDPIELATNLLGRDAFFAPILVEEGYIHVRVVGTASAAGKQFGEMLRRISAVTTPDDFKLTHSGDYDPMKRLRPRTDHLSPRQEEVLQMAIELGYYDDPRKCTLETLAKQFGVSKAAVHKRLVSAESKIIKSYYA
ncbi:MAG: helix-turn-helix domain-containing protein [Euryarchaeota archaeon]|nr:helix-turn-helix domain-containing protein [Euryarchaeota archaeon]